MLVLSRKRFEGLQIGDNIKITVVKIDRNGVRLGIEAPEGVTILREELLLDAEDRSARQAWDASASASTSPVAH
jgi:carbon storage regulator